MDKTSRQKTIFMDVASVFGMELQGENRVNDVNRAFCQELTQNGYTLVLGYKGFVTTEENTKAIAEQVNATAVHIDDIAEVAGQFGDDTFFIVSWAGDFARLCRDDRDAAWVDIYDPQVLLDPVQTAYNNTLSGRAALQKTAEALGIAFEMKV